ncbi:MAG: helix-turn-helix domain-containing protein [Lachnospiraceae bacterium]|nr:helix-turn-helix domain-containing protein [Lachnospiraceae bacterium]
MIGTKLRILRQQNHLSQEKLAEELGVSRNTVSKWESNVCDPDIENLKALCQYFHCNVAYFLDQQQEDGGVSHDDADQSDAGRSQPGGFCDHWMELLLFVEIVFFLGLYILSWVVPSKQWITRTGQAPVEISFLAETEQGSDGDSNVSSNRDTGQESADNQETYNSYIDTKGFFPFMSTYHLWPVAVIVAADAVINVILIVRKRNRTQGENARMGGIYRKGKRED